MTTDEYILGLAEQAAAAARTLAGLSTDAKNQILQQMASGILDHDEAIVTANARDLDAARAAGLSQAMLDRLTLDRGRIEAMAEGLRQVAALPDPVGDELGVNRRPNGLIIRKVRVPLGVIVVIYESRPNVTSDAAGLCFKSGNAVILRGGSEALHSNAAIVVAMLDGGCAAGLPANAIELVQTADREAVHALLQQEQHVDLVIPRGGESLIRAVAEHSRVPVLKHYKGVCHVYVDRDADQDMAVNIVVNAKCQRPGVCNAMETLLVHDQIAEAFLPRVANELLSHGVELRGDDRTCRIVDRAKSAVEADWSEEYLDLIAAVRVVASLEAAIDHIEQYGTHHSDVIVTNDNAAAQRYTREVDSATVYVNASSRFTDGYEFGMGAEIGISTGKLHARGPCGLEELTTYKYIIQGTGQVRT